MKRDAITQARLKELLHYDPETGVFTWLVDRTGGVKAGDHRGTMMGAYLTFWVDGISYKAHRLAFLYMSGALPDEHVDHINCVKTDNRWKNLRAATNSQNQHNRGVATSNTGCKNVTWLPKRGKYLVGLRLKKKSLFIGYFEDLEFADLVAHEAREKYHGQFARHC